MPDRPDIDAELDLFQRLNERAARGVDRLPGAAQRQYLREQLAHRSGVVGASDPGRYRPPAFLAKVVGPAHADALHALLLQIRALNDEHLGESVDELAILLNGDPAILALRHALRAWAEPYVARRVARKHPRDRDDPVRTFLRLTDELVPWLEELAYTGPVDSLHGLVLDEVCDYLPWLVFRATWGPELTITPTEGRSLVDWGRVDREWVPLCMEYVQLYSWGTDPSFRELAAALGDGEAPPDADERLRGLASDLAEMRPLLVRNFRPERTIFELVPGLLVAWIWNVGHRVGSVLAAATERELLEALARGVVRTSVHVHHDGSVRDYKLSWRRLDEQAGGRVATYRLVEAVHRRLFGFYDRIDFAALAPRAPDAVEVDEAPDDLVVARACEVLRRRDPDPSGRLGVRTSQLLAILERLGCEVRPGKGSEISIYRPGGRIWTLGHHKRNPSVGWAYVRQVLRRLAIPTEAWVAAAR